MTQASGWGGGVPKFVYPKIQQVLDTSPPQCYNVYDTGNDNGNLNGTSLPPLGPIQGLAYPSKKSNHLKALPRFDTGNVESETTWLEPRLIVRESSLASTKIVEVPLGQGSFDPSSTLGV